MRMYTGQITEVDSNNLYLIKFIIPFVYEDRSNPLTAVPLCRLSRNPIKGDEIILIKPEEELNLFYYILSHEDPELISIQYDKDNFIKLSKSNNNVVIDVKCSGDLTVNSGGNVKINSGSSGNVLINNHLKVTP